MEYIFYISRKCFNCGITEDREAVAGIKSYYKDDIDYAFCNSSQCNTITEGRITELQRRVKPKPKRFK